MIYDFVTGAGLQYQFPIYGRLIPFNTTGIPLLWVALGLLVTFLLFARMLPPKMQRFGAIVIALIALTSSYFITCRWLDDMFVNLVHPWNLLQHGRFSVSPSHMVNGTVELLYYFLLTPFAFSRESLILACYGLGWLIGALHLVVLGRLLREKSPMLQALGLFFFATSFPLIAMFACGYGNGAVSLVTFWAVLGIIEGKPRQVAYSCALLPLLRPDAILYVICIAAADLIITRRFKPLMWLPSVVSAILYFATVHLMYGQWMPTPMMLKKVGVKELLSAAPILLQDIPAFIQSEAFRYNEIIVLAPAKHDAPVLPFHLAYLVLAVASTVLLKNKKDGVEYRKVLIWLGCMSPIFVFYRLTGQYGYNPTLARYYAGFELAWTVAGLVGAIHIAEALRERFSSRNLLSSLSPTVAVLSFAVPICLVAGQDAGRFDGVRLGIDTNTGRRDLQRMDYLSYGGRYCDDVLPKGWHIASLEMDTFGFASGREMLDLWGFSNMDIAKATATGTYYGIKVNPHVFPDSNVEVFWLRTLRNNQLMEEDILKIANSPASDLPKAMAHSLALSKKWNLAGDLNYVFLHYDVFRIRHGNSVTTILLVRKDLSAELISRLRDRGHSLTKQSKFDMASLREYYTVGF